MPHRLVRMVEPIVRHGIRENALGVPLEHTLRQVAIMGVLVGAGASPARAIASVERREASLIGISPQEAAAAAGTTGMMWPGAQAYPMGWTVAPTAMPWTATMPWTAEMYGAYPGTMSVLTDPDD